MTVFRAGTFGIPGTSRFKAEVMFSPIFTIKIILAQRGDSHAERMIDYLARINAEGLITWSNPSDISPVVAEAYSEAIALAANMARHLDYWKQSFETLDMISDDPKSEQTFD